jgi:hypothetical protein
VPGERHDSVGPGWLRLRGDPGSVLPARLEGTTVGGRASGGAGSFPRAHRQNGGCSCEIKERPSRAPTGFAGETVVLKDAVCRSIRWSCPVVAHDASALGAGSRSCGTWTERRWGANA